MGKPIVNEIGQEKTILKFAKYEGFTAKITKPEGVDVVKAGTPYPANDATCKGYILHDVDVSQGDALATVVNVGHLKEAAITANGITVSSNAKNATKRVIFY